MKKNSHNKQKIIPFGVLLLAFSINLFAQIVEKNYLFKHLNSEDGLSNNVVFDLYQDSDGYIWIATNNGLNRYDGYSITSYFHNPKDDSTSISSNVIKSIVEDQEGYLWFGTKHGINRFNKKTQCFEKPTNRNGFSFSDKEVREMYLDESGKIWMNASNDIVVFDPETFEAALVHRSNSIMHITLANHNIWISDNKGNIVSYNINTKKLVKRTESFKSNAIHFGEFSESLWIPVNFKSNLNTGEFKYLPELPNNINPKHLLEIDTRKTWIGTNNGLFEYNSESNSLSKIYLGKSTLINQIRSLYKDNTGGVWVGTLAGVFHHDPNRKVFTHTDIIEDYDDIIMALHCDENGIYANALGKGLYFKSNNSNQFEKLELHKMYPKDGLFIWDIETVPENDFSLWLAGNKGIICLNPKTLEFQTLDVQLSKNEESVSFSILKTEQEFLWLASHSTIHKVRKRDGKHLESFTMDDEMKYAAIQKIIAFSDYLFIATENNGLFKFDITTKQFSNVYLNNSNQRLDIPIWDLYAVSNILWIGANDGLYKLEANTIFVEPVLRDNQIVFSIIQDESGVLWMGSDKGIKSYNPDNEKAKYYTTLDGLKNIGFNRKSVIKDASNNLWFGGANGTTTFNPKLIKKDNPNVPPVHITNLRITTSDSTFSISNLKENITLPWEHNTLELEYVGLNYTNTLKNRYKYKMEGHDPNWVSAKKPNIARYVKLPVGTYNFKVNATNNDGIWNTEGDTIKITIKPPLWRTNTAYVLYIVSFLGLIWLFRRLKTYRNRISQVEQEKEIIAKKVEEEFIVLNNKTKVYLKDLKYVRAAGNYLEFHCVEKVILDRNKLKLLQEQLPPNFIRTHRSYIVNKNYIISANSASVIIKPNIETPLSRSFKGSLE